MAAPSFFEEKRGGIEPRLGRNITCPFVFRKAVLTCWFSAPGSAVHSLHPAFTSWAWPCVIRMLPAFFTNAGTMSGWGSSSITLSPISTKGWKAATHSSGCG